MTDDRRGLSTEQAIQTLRYWMDMEVLTPPEAEADGENDGAGSFETRHVPARPLPWLDPSFGAPDVRYQHLVRFGIFRRDVVHENVLRALAAPPEMEPTDFSRPLGFAGAFAVAHDGRAIANSLSMPAFGIVLEGLRSGVLPDLDEALDACRQALQADYGAAAGRYAAAGHLVDEAFVTGLLDAASDRLHWLRILPQGLPLAVVRSTVTSVMAEVEVKDSGFSRPRRRRREVQRQAVLPPVDGPSFEDLRSALRSMRANDAGLVRRVLTGTGERIDCTDRAFVAASCTASTHPRARWPATRDLALMQQVAVDLATGSLAEGGLFSVHAPPGSGSLAVLMDLAAAAVQRRAEALCAFQTPADAFDLHAWSGPFGPVHGLHPSLRDHPFVVVSATDEDADEVARALSRADAIDERFAAALRTLAPAADALLGAAAPTPFPAWGLVAAALGRGESSARTADALDRHELDGTPAGSNIFGLLAAARPSLNWDLERTTFLRALAEVGALAAELSEAEEDDGSLAAAARARTAAIEGEAARLSAEWDDSRAAEAAAALELAGFESAFEHADQGLEVVMRAQPPGFLSLLRPDVSTRWKHDLSGAATLRAEADRRLAMARAAHRAAHRRAADLRAAVERAVSDRAAAQDEEARIAAVAASFSARHGGLVTVGDVAAEPDTARREQRLPGSSAALRDARARLFVAALRVHLAFAVVAGPALFDRNLRAALAMLRGSVGIKPVAERAAADLWATLAVLTPVISTSVGSLSDIFAHLGADRIPWLVINEAGQIAPQDAVGALWRAKRAVVMGDPLARLPNTVVSESVEAAVAAQRAIPDPFRMTTASAQTIADAANPFGTVIHPYGQPPLWIGCPLRVETRCAEPMFSLSNRLAYGGSLVLASDKIEEEAALSRTRPLLGESRWIDVPARQGGGDHFARRQSDVVRQIVNACAEQGLVTSDGLPDLFVISPFRSMADGVRRALCDDLIARRRDPARVAAWAASSIGTVATLRGEAREAVVLALGVANDRAIQRVCEKPNMMNVIVTQAKRRLYVVGDRSRWRTASPWFELLAALPVSDSAGTLVRASATSR